MEEIEYQEVQKVRNIWIWGLFALLSIIFFCSFFEQIILQRPSGDVISPNWSLAIMGLFPFSILFFILSIKLAIKINKIGISFRFSPFHLRYKELNWSEIDKIYMRKYNPISEFGGWGIRTLSFRKNIAYNISGNTGLQIELKNGKRILLGTQNGDELEQVIDKYNQNLFSKEKNKLS
jgi:hypothetical protein